MLKKLVKFILTLIAIPTILTAAYLKLDQNGFFNLSTVEIYIVGDAKQDNFVKPFIANIAQSMENLKGRSLWKLEIQEVVVEIKKQAWVQEVHVTRNWPSTLKVDIRPREVQLVYLNRQGDLQPVFAEGVMLEPIQATQAPDVAVLQGESFANNKELRSKAVQVVRELPEQGTFSRKAISEMSYSASEGFWVKQLHSGLKVKLGEAEIPAKSQRVSQVLDYLLKKNIRAEELDANLNRKVVVRVANQVNKSGTAANGGVIAIGEESGIENTETKPNENSGVQ